VIERFASSADRGRLLVANGVVQVDNIGGLFRTAACLGADAVLLDDACADPLLRKSIRFSMGRVFDLPWGVSRGLVDDLGRLRALHVHCAALELVPGARPVEDLAVDTPLAIVVGSETRGIDPAVLAACDAAYAIPARPPDEDGEARSLNVGVAAAIALYAARGRGQ
jgi:tRNA G18 (ribose-2'-O)-methylase SpoU